MASVPDRRVCRGQCWVSDARARRVTVQRGHCANMEIPEFLTAIYGDSGRSGGRGGHYRTSGATELGGTVSTECKSYKTWLISSIPFE